jgi:DNA-binding transcriptional MerR regulator
MNKYITAGGLAKLACTTKRTIQYYDRIGILKPARVNSKKYRMYSEQQILDYQKILLLASLGVTLSEMKKYVRKNGNLTQLFRDKKELIKQQIKELSFSLNSLDRFLKNLNTNGTMVNPEVKSIPPFDIYYIEKVGPYAKIADYCRELSDMFESRGKNFTTLAIFDDPTYQPKSSHIKICALADKKMKVKNEFMNLVNNMTFNPGKVITYTHNGAGNLLSLSWKELEKYCRLHGLIVRKDTPDFEIYRKVNEDITKQFFEIYLPIK